MCGEAIAGTGQKVRLQLRSQERRSPGGDRRDAVGGIYPGRSVLHRTSRISAVRVLGRLRRTVRAIGAATLAKDRRERSNANRVGTEQTPAREREAVARTGQAGGEGV